MFQLVVVVHFCFIIWVAVGGLLSMRWWRLAFAHLPALTWAVLLEWNGWICPLTPLENGLRAAEGAPVYDTGFVEHYLIPLIYPAGLTRSIQTELAVILVVVNGVAYAWMLRTHFLKRASSERDG